jgi:hypothetical protein
MQRRGKYTSTTIEEQYFLRGPYRGFTLKAVGVTVQLPCGGGFEYLHRSPASRRRRRKGNPVPGGYKYWDLALQVEGVSSLRQ